MTPLTLADLRKVDQMDEPSVVTLREALVGKTIAAIVTQHGPDRIQIDNSDDFEVDSGDILITFTDGSAIVAWNSEWGGLRTVKDADKPLLTIKVPGGTIEIG